jgi:hypothetical protein
VGVQQGLAEQLLVRVAAQPDRAIRRPGAGVLGQFGGNDKGVAANFDLRFCTAILFLRGAINLFLSY